MKPFAIVTFWVLALPLVLTAAEPDTLVVCPAEFRAALAPWVEFRRSQGHELLVVDVPRDAAELRTTIRQAAAGGRLEYVLLVGDAPKESPLQEPGRSITIPTNFVPAKINSRWGSEPTIATDALYAHLDGDGLADLAVGRIPADSADELSAVVRKILRYEREAGQQPWERRLSAVAGAGGFGPLVDSLIESMGQHLMTQALPAGYVLGLTRADLVPPKDRLVRKSVALALSDADPKPIRHQLNDGCLAWVYLGHGERTELDYVAGPLGPESILSVDDVPALRCGVRCPLAVLMTCHAGAFDAEPDCLAEELLMAEEGPVAVIASTRVSMPYGNSVFGYELLRASLADRPATLGAAMALAQRRVLSARSDDPLRTSLDKLAENLSPLLHRNGVRWQAEDLLTERNEHVAMYKLLGDPLLKWRRPQPIEIKTAAEVAAGASLDVDGRAEFDGGCLVELVRPGADSDSSKGTLASTAKSVKSGPFRISLPIPVQANGHYAVRAYLSSPNRSAIGGAKIVVRPNLP
jgi:hypothetical protein